MGNQRPCAAAEVSVEEELDRVIPALEAIAQRLKCGFRGYLQTRGDP